MPSYSVQVAAGNDDGFWDTVNGCFRTAGYVWMGYYTNGHSAKQHGTFRFQNVALDKRFKIVRARLRMNSPSDQLGATFHLHIHLDKAANASDLVPTCDPDSRVLTTAYGSWGDLTVVQDAWFYSSDFSAALQEHLDGAFVWGNALAVVLVQQETSGTYIRAKSFEEAGATYAAWLEVDYAYRGFAGCVI